MLIKNINTNTKLETIQDIKKQEMQLLNLICLHLEKLEIANALFVDPLLLDEFASVYYKCSFETLQSVFIARSNALLVDKQFEKALDGDTKMLIFLGKNYAKQVDSGEKALLSADTIVIQDSATLPSEVLNNDVVCEEPLLDTLTKENKVPQN